jgi:hypothetical protein
MDNFVATAEERSEAEKKEENVKAETTLAANATLFNVAQPVRKVVMIIYKKILVMVCQALRLVQHLRKFGNPDDLPPGTTLLDMIETTKVWLVDQMAKHFPPEKSVYLSRRWKKLAKTSLKLLRLGKVRARSSALKGPKLSGDASPSRSLRQEDEEDSGSALVFSPSV